MRVSDPNTLTSALSLLAAVLLIKPCHSFRCGVPSWDLF